MVVHGLPPMFLAAAVLLCANPVSAPNADGASDDMAALIASRLEGPNYEVVAASPLPAGHAIGGGYGYRISRRTGERTFHAGLDFTAARGTPVYAVRAGTIEQVAAEGRRRNNFWGYGNAVVVHHPELGRWSFYAHLEDVAVEPGQHVEPGQLIGHVGQSNNGRFPGMAPHLHFEVRRARGDGGSPFPGAYRQHNLDPAPWLAEMGVHLHRSDDPHEHCVMHGEGAGEATPMLVVRPAGSTDGAVAIGPAREAAAQL